jgi:hypothetical protein
MNLNDIIIKIEYRKPRDFDDSEAKRVEELVFVGYHQHTKVGYIVVDRWIQPTDSQMNDSFFRDFNFQPPLPRPFLFFMNTENEYRGQSIAAHLI